MNHRPFHLAALALSAALAVPLAHAADPAPTGRASIIDTPAPGGWLGVYGFDVFESQSVAARFSVPATADHRLLRVGLWLMNNSETQQLNVRVSLQTDALDEGGTETLPSGRKLASWVAPVAMLGWNPVEQFFSVGRGNFPKLVAGRNYWVVAESRSPALVNPVWTVSSEGTMVTTTTQNGAWQTAGEGGALTLQVDALPID